MNAADAPDLGKERTARLTRRRAALRRLKFGLAAVRSPTRVEIAEWFAAQFEIETGARSIFFLIPIGLMIGVAITDGAGFRMELAPLVILALAMLALAHRTGGPGSVGAGILLTAFTLAGMALAVAEIRWTDTTIFSGESTVRIEGRVTWRDRDERDRMRYLVRIERTERPVLSRPPELVSILVSSRHEAIEVGGRFNGLVRLRAPSGPAYPGAYDFAFAPFFQGRGANGFAMGPPEPAGAETVKVTLGERLARLRLAMSDRIREVIGGGAGAVASALITGERSGIPDDIDDWLRATGLSHVLSISGLHMALVAGFAMLLVRGILAAVPGAALTLPTKKIAAVAALIVATAYLVISGSDVATDRSYVMLSIMLVAILVDRPALTLRNVAIAAIVVIVTTPHAVVTASFQMSFSATAALVGVYGALSRHRAARAGQGSSGSHPVLTACLFLAGLAASSAIAGTATAPYAAYHFQRVAPYGIVANLIAVPIFSFWIMPLALIAVLAMPFGLDAPILTLIGWALELVFAIAKVLAAYFPDAPSGRLTTEGLLVLTAALLIACLPASRLRWGAVPVVLLGLVLLPDKSSLPDLLVYEDGRELATIDSAGELQPLRKRPNDFVFEQWTRAFPVRPAAEKRPSQVGAATRTPRETAAGPLHPDENAASTPMKERSNAPDSGPARSAPADDNQIYESPARAEPVKTKTISSAFTCEQSPFPNDAALPPPPNPLPAPVTSLSPAAGPATQPAVGPDAAAAINTNNEREPNLSPALRPGTAATVEARGVANAGGSMSVEPPTTEQSAGNVPPPASVRKPPPPRQICRARTRNGLRIVWTDDHRLLGLACDIADVAIVARAVALRECRSGAQLVTLRTLRETGSLAISYDAIGKKPILTRSITDPSEPWNVHRRAAWPEYWRNPETTNRPAEPSAATAATSTP